MIDSIKNLMTSGGGLAAAGAVIIASWNYIKTAWRYLVGIVIGETILKEDAGKAAMAFAFNKSIRSPLGKKVFGGYESYVHPKRWVESVAYECISSDPVLIRYGRQFAILSLNGSHVSASEIGDHRDPTSVVKLRYLRWFFDPEKFINDAIEYYNSEKRQTSNSSYLGLMEEPQRLLLAKHILSDFPELIEETVKAGEGETAAQFQSRCAQLALDKFWENGGIINDDKYDRYVEAVHINPSTSTWNELVKNPVNSI